jgi:alanine-glyoxylate transaminase/serine-glyoxylate transaminase/serine-pyruvate transaminase
VTTAAFGLPGMDVSGYLEWLLKNHRIRIGGGLGELRGRIFRVGHMGRAAEPEAIDRYLRATADYVEHAGLTGAGRKG